MTINEDAERMKQLLTEAITVLCKSGFNFSSHFCVEGLLGITFDSKDIVLLNIKETIKLDKDDTVTKEPASLSRSSVRSGQKKRKRLKMSDSLSESENEDPVDMPVENEDDPIPTQDEPEEVKTPSPGKKRRGSPRGKRVPNKEALQVLTVEIHRAKEEPAEKDNQDEDSEFTSFMTSPGQKSPASANSLPEAVKKFSVGDLRRIVVSLVTSEVPEGIGYPGWGKPEKKPSWWPDDVPWTKWGVQRGIKRFQLERLVTEAMSYHGGQLPQPKDKKTTKSPNLRKTKVPDEDESSTTMNVVELREEHMTMELQQIAQEGQQTILVTTEPPRTARKT